MTEEIAPTPKPRGGTPWQVDVPRRWLVLAFIGAVGGGLATGRLLGSMIPALLAGFVGHAVVLSLALVTFALIPPPLRMTEKLGVRHLRLKDVGVALAGLIAVYVWQFFTLPLWEMLLEHCGLEFETRQHLLTECACSTPGRFIAIVVFAGIVIPFAEELLFRRMLFGIFRPLGVFVALLATALIFAAVHDFIYGFPVLFMLGAIFQCEYLLTGNLLTSTLTHMTYNLISLTLTFALGQPS